jgi:DNA-binding response OmpR family regulator
MRILLIESDERFARSLIKDMEKNGYSVDYEVDASSILLA